MFKKNIDNSGRILRLVIATLLLVYALWKGSWIALALGIFTLVEAAFSWCILYQILGWNSCPVEHKTEDKNHPK